MASISCPKIFPKQTCSAMSPNSPPHSMGFKKPHRQKQANRLRELSVVWPHKPGRIPGSSHYQDYCFFFLSNSNLNFNNFHCFWVGGRFNWYVYLMFFFPSYMVEKKLWASQLGSFPPIFEVKMQNPWNHHLEGCMSWVWDPPKIPVDHNRKIYHKTEAREHRTDPYQLEKVNTEWNLKITPVPKRT